MSTTTGVAVWGLGRAGLAMVRLCAARPELRLVAGITTTPQKRGVDLGTLAGIESVGAVADDDGDALLGRGDVDVILHGGLGDGPQVGAYVGRCVDAGKSVVTVSGFVHPPTDIGAEAALALHRRAQATGARAVGTGVNPGFILDALPVLLAGLALPLSSVSARRVVDMRYWGDGALFHEGGAGYDADAVPPPDPSLSLKSSIGLIADALGGRLGTIEETHEPLVSLVDRSDGARSIRAGQTMGFHRRARVTARQAEIAIEWIAIFCLDAALDGGLSPVGEIVLEGPAEVRCSLTGDALVDPYPATAGRAVAAIGPLLTLPPGLYRPDQLPGSATDWEA